MAILSLQMILLQQSFHFCPFFLVTYGIFFSVVIFLPEPEYNIANNIFKFPRLLRVYSENLKTQSMFYKMMYSPLFMVFAILRVFSGFWRHFQHFAEYFKYSDHSLGNYTHKQCRSVRRGRCRTGLYVNR